MSSSNYSSCKIIRNQNNRGIEEESIKDKHYQKLNYIDYRLEQADNKPSKEMRKKPAKGVLDCFQR